MTKQIAQFLKDLGWMLAPEKCRMIPYQRFKCLGWQWNTITMDVQMPAPRRKKMKTLVKNWIEEKKNNAEVNVHSLAHLIGELSFLRFQMTYASLAPNSLNHLKTVTILNGNWGMNLKLHKYILSNLYQLLDWINLNKPRLLQDSTPSITLTTDASETGWGSTLEVNQQLQMDTGQWGPCWLLISSNKREMTAVIKGLRSFTLEMQTNETRCFNLLTDNMTVMYYLRKWKARKPLLLLVRIIEQIYKKIKICLVVSYILGLNNTQADSLNRLAWFEDFMLDQITLLEALNTLKFFLTLDCFANRTKKTIEKVFLRILRLQRYKSQSIHNELGTRTSLNSPSDQLDPESYQQNNQRSCECLTNNTELVQDQVLTIDNKCVEGIELGPITSSTYPKQENAEQRFREVIPGNILALLMKNQ
ncbi:MAG: hypothetical protein EZS28_000242 [Streblomastix strix]|uniref:RNase H type-1 domain-containing protein n=1 Tax=Streblomastix strix TaxID=222440 RepID=A0A5J4XBC2_9EUKA|nr:MAG: hypothetical protein EZS28_000242 [Streblomastix strix]